jgi:hypothetical protein
VPSGWTVNGQPSTGNWIITSQNVTVTYPASNIGGSIKVKASYYTICCGDLQVSKESEAISVNRTVNFLLTANKSDVLCGDTDPVTFTVTPALPCAIYYWNNSQTATTSNYCQVTPNGISAINATVYIVYGTSNATRAATLQYKNFATGVTPTITGSQLLCTGDSYEYTVSNLRPGYTVDWVKGPNLIENSRTTTTINIKTTSLGTSTIDATVYSQCGQTSVSKLPLQLGSPTPDTITIDFDAPPGRFTASIESVPFALSYNWYCDGVLNNSHSTVARFFRQIDNCEHVYYVDVVAVTSCPAASSICHAEVSEPPCYYYSIYPNPASTEVSITQNQSKTAIVQRVKKPIKVVQITDKFGRQLLKQKFGDEVYETKLTISKLQTGSYTMQINQGADMETYTLIKE